MPCGRPKEEMPEGRAHQGNHLGRSRGVRSRGGGDSTSHGESPGGLWAGVRGAGPQGGRVPPPLQARGQRCAQGKEKWVGSEGGAGRIS